MGFTDRSEWIWLPELQQNDSYAEFTAEFNYTEKPLFIRISVDSNYTLCINGTFVNSGQYPDFPHYKVYDEFEISDYCQKGINSVSVTVWYYGSSNMSYYPGNAALRYEIFDGSGETVSCSAEGMPCRKLNTYENGRCKLITAQLGFGYAYDFTKEDSLPRFTQSRRVDQKLPLYKRPIEKLSIGERAPSALVKHEDNFLIFDLGHEEVGYLTFKLLSEKQQSVTISYGEHLDDGRVRRIIGNRDFSFDFTLKEGVNEYTNYLRRLGLRYLEITFSAPLTVEYLSVLPTVYPLSKVERRFESELHQRIYDVSVRTLELCMHDHYEDCPWREQALYAMDGRNQIICGYYAFNEYQFPRANLYLMSKDNREDGLLSICTPTELDLTIPSFSLHYFTEVYEYSVYSKDLTLAKEVLPKLKSVLKVFLDSMKDGLVPRFPGECHWNFYEWADNLADAPRQIGSTLTDAALNMLLSIALSNMQKTCELVGEKADYTPYIEELNKKINEVFFDSESGLYYDDTTKTTKSELVSSLAILSGAADGERAEKIAAALVSENTLTKITLSMACFKYDALLKVDKEKYKDYIIKSIENRYLPQLNAGATAFWETDLGAADFDNAGSLCHGWSAMPVYYLSTILAE